MWFSWCHVNHAVNSLTEINLNVSWNQFKYKNN